MKNHASDLAAKVAAVNRANATVNALCPVIRDVFNRLDGQKIIKTDQSLLESVKKQLPELQNGNGLQVIFSPSSNNICFIIKAYELGEFGHAVYHESYFYAAGLNGQICKKWNGSEFVPQRTDWTVEEVAKKRAIAEAAREAARQAERECYPFDKF